MYLGQVLNFNASKVLGNLPSPRNLSLSDCSSLKAVSGETAKVDHEHAFQDLITNVATSFIDHGGPSHRIKPVIEALGDALKTPTAVYSMSTHTILAFSPPKKRGPPTIYPINKRGSMNFTKLPYVFKLVKDIVRRPGKNSLDDINNELKRIEALPNAWDQYAIAASYVPAAATSAIMFFGGDWRDAAMSGALAVIPALLLLAANKWERLWV